MFKRLILAGLMVFLVCVFGCKKPLPESIIVVDGATDIKFLEFRGQNHLSYKVSERYPAPSTISRITTPLEKGGWMPLKEKFFYPGVPTSCSTGWSFFEEKQFATLYFVYQWSCDWKDQNNNVVSYVLQYRDAIDKYRKSTYIVKPSSPELTVTAIYVPNQKQK